jgi:hypothetical protein
MAYSKSRPKCDWKSLVEIEERLRKWSSFNNIRKWLANGYQACVGKHPSKFYLELYDSISRRLRKVIKAKGCLTKY